MDCMFGFLNVDKPSGITSFDAIRILQRRLGRAEKIGHAGTLDPFAQGVLVVCLGHATRLVRFLAQRPKHYQAEITLGATSSTDDPEGEIIPGPDAAIPSGLNIEAALAGFVGAIQQAPPAYSAVHVGGKRAYALARAGKKPILAAKPVMIHALELLGYEYPVLRIRVACGGGTYIRSLARDIGQNLGTGAYCSKLVRTAVGPFRLDQARPAQDLRLPEDLVSPLRALEDMQVLALPAAQVEQVYFGRQGRSDCPATPGQAALTDQAGNLIALVRVGDDGFTLQPEMVFPPER
jgi:tRNA pseudouridine55 synthase